MMVVKKISIDSPDYQEALAIRKNVFVLEQGVPEVLEVDGYEEICDHFLLTVNKTPAGAGRLRVKDQVIKFERIACLKNFRGTGVGKTLMQFMLEYTLAHYPNHTPYMHSQIEAVPFYEKLGWLPQGEVFFEASIPHLAMIHRSK